MFDHDLNYMTTIEKSTHVSQKSSYRWRDGNRLNDKCTYLHSLGRTCCHRKRVGTSSPHSRVGSDTLRSRGHKPYFLQERKKKRSHINKWIKKKSLRRKMFLLEWYFCYRTIMCFFFYVENDGVIKFFAVCFSVEVMQFSNRKYHQS